MPKKKRSSMGMSRAAVQGVFSDVFTSDVSSSHYVSHGDASRRETAAFGPDVHAPPPPGLDRSSLHRGGDTVADTLTNIESDLAEPPPIVAVEENGCDTRSFGLQPQLSWKQQQVAQEHKPLQEDTTRTKSNQFSQ